MRRLIGFFSADLRLTKKRAADLAKRLRNYHYLRSRKLNRLDAWRSAMDVL